MASRVHPAIAPPHGMLQALAHPAFALIASATLVSNVGVWMRDTTSAWTVGASGPAAVSLVQAATMLPTLLLALPAGVLADHYDRRRLLIVCQIVLAGCGIALAAMSALGILDVGGIVLLALVAGSAAAVAAPAFQAIVPALVPREDLSAAVALSAVSFNLARVVGPAVGGLLLAAAGPAATYAGNAIGYLCTVAALLALPTPPAPLPRVASIRFREELHEGMAFLATSSLFRRIVARGMALYGCAACYLTLTPLIARALPGGGPSTYGALLAATGIGSIAAGGALSLLRRARIGEDETLAGCAAAAAAALLLLSLAEDVPTAAAALALAGGSTLVQLATLNAAVQIALPDAIRGRGLAIYMAATFGCMGVGSLAWGAVAQSFSLATAVAAGGGLYLAVAFAGRAIPIQPHPQGDQA